MTGRAKRRWPHRLPYGAVALLVGVLAAFGWAWSSVDRSTIARALWWGEADVGDQFRFPARPIQAGKHASLLPSGGEIDLPEPRSPLP